MRGLLVLLMVLTATPAHADEPWRLLDWLPTRDPELRRQITEFFRLDPAKMPAVAAAPGGLVLTNPGGAPVATAWAPYDPDAGLWTWRFRARGTAPGSALFMTESASFPPSEDWQWVGVTAEGGLPGAMALTLRGREGRLEVCDMQRVRLPFTASASVEGGRLQLQVDGEPVPGMQVELRSLPLEEWRGHGPGRRIPFEAPFGAMTLAPEALPEPYLVRWRLLDAEGRVLHGGGTLRVGDPAPPARGPVRRDVQVGPGGVLHVEGKPFLPLGLYTHETGPGALDAVQELGLNLAIMAPSEGVVEEARRRGLEVILETVVPPDDVRASQVERFGHLPVLAWTAVDEPDLKPPYAAVLDDVYRAVAGADSRPLYQSNHSPASFPWAAAATDILAVDPYPLGVIPRPLTTVGRQVDEARAVTPSVWYINQAFVMAPFWTEAPSPEQLRAMTWISLIHGARGIVYYVLHDILDPNSADHKWELRRSPLWAGIQAEARELSALQEWLLLPEGPERILFEGPIEGAIWRRPGGSLVALVNPLPEQAMVQLEVGPSRLLPDGPALPAEVLLRLEAYETVLLMVDTPR